MKQREIPGKEGITDMLPTCPDCGAPVQLGKTAKEGHQIECSECGAVLEVISLDPPELDYADWDDWDDEDED